MLNYTPPKIFKIGKVFYLLRTKGLFWFRFFNGYGIQGKNKLHEPMFSERYGYHRYLRIGGWRFRILKP